MAKKKNELWEWIKALVIAVIISCSYSLFLICSNCCGWFVDDADIK